MAIEIVGGDSFLHLSVQPGHEVIVSGYDGEPYLRVSPDGVVEQNKRSPAVKLNTSRWGTIGEQPSYVDANAEPEWERIATGGDYVWHDHRVHWMGKDAPPQLRGAGSGTVFDDWTVPLTVDGTATTVHGRLLLESPPSAVPWFVLACGLALAIGLLLGRRAPVAASAVALAVSSGAALVVSWMGQFGLPSEAGRQYHLVIVPAIALVAAVAGLLLRRTPSGSALVAGSALTLGLWIAGTYGVLTHAYAPTDVDVGVQRATIAVVIGSVAGAAVVGLVHEARALRER
jgi:hypothetical protein